MSRLTKEQTYSIKWLSSQGISSIEIATELSITEKQVQKILEKSTNSSDNPKIKTAKSPVSKSHDMMIRRTSSKNTNNVSIMTKEASQYNDQLKSSLSVDKKSDHIFRPKNNG